MSTQADKLNTGVIGTIVVVGALSMISISSLLTALVRSEERSINASRPTNADLTTVAELKRAQQATLDAPVAWKDKAAGRVTMPIEAAMEVVLAQYKRDPEAASPPVPPGLVLPGAAPGAMPAAGTPAPAASAAEAPTGSQAPAGPGAPGAPAGAAAAEGAR